MEPLDMLLDSVETGDLDGVRKAIADGADPKAHDSDALSWAAEKGYVECVRELIPVSNPQAIGSWALRWAAWNGHVECARLLLPVSDVEVARTRLKGNGWNDALALLDSIIEEEASKAKHLKQASGRTGIGL